MKRQYVQFSKRCVVAVLIAAHAVVLVAMAVMIAAGDLAAMGEVVRHYFSFASVVFVAYCGNSAIEKVAVKLTGVESVTGDDSNG